MVIEIFIISVIVSFLAGMALRRDCVGWMTRWRTRTEDRGNFKCLCCGYATLAQEPTWTLQICPVCFWEDDGSQYEDPTGDNGANTICLEEARNNFKTFGATERRFIKYVRPPSADEIP